MCIRDSYCMNLCGKAKHKVDLGADALGNLTRIENELSKPVSYTHTGKPDNPCFLPMFHLLKSPARGTF